MESIVCHNGEYCSWELVASNFAPMGVAVRARLRFCM